MNTRIQLLVVALGLSSFVGCSCEQQIVKKTPKIEVLDDMGAERTLVDFGSAQLNIATVKELRVRNSGAGPLTIAAATFSKPVFGANTTFPLTLAVNEEQLLKLTFTPTEADQRITGSVTLATDDPARATVEVQLAGTGIEAVAVLMPAALNFGEVYLGESKSLMISLTNSGSNELEVTDAAFTSATSAQYSAPLAMLKGKLAAGASSTLMVTLAPTMQGPATGSLELTLGGNLGKVTVALSGKGIQAQPRLCLKYDDSAMESCTAPGVDFLQVSFGSYCDNRLFPNDGGPTPCLTDGGSVASSRAAKFYIRNEGNTPVQYTLKYDTGLGTACDGGSQIDFEFANAPQLPDGGRQASWMDATSKLPALATDPKPWETSPVAVVYRPRSNCRLDASDQARVVFTRQGEPLGTMRLPQSLIVNVTGQSRLPRAGNQDVTMMGTVPQTVDFKGVANGGDAPLRITGVSTWQAEYLADGGRGTQPFEVCDPSSTGDCAVFSWEPGHDPASILPLTLAGTNMPTNPVATILGRMVFGAADAGTQPLLNKPYQVFVVIETDDPYSPQVVASVKGTAR